MRNGPGGGPGTGQKILDPIPIRVAPGRLQYAARGCAPRHRERAFHGTPGRWLCHALDRRPQGRRRLCRPAPLGAILPPPRPPRPRPAPLGAPGRGDRGRGGRGLERLRQLLPRRRPRPLPPARRPRRPLAAAGRHHRPQGPRPARTPGVRRSAAAAGWSASRP